MTLGKGGDKAVVVVVGWEGVRKERKRSEVGKKKIELRNNPQQKRTRRRRKKKKKKQQFLLLLKQERDYGMKLKRKKKDARDQ